jgi:hypothetical protein
MARTRKSRCLGGITPDGTRVGVYCAFLARFVLDNRLDAIEAAKAWTGAQAFLRVASNGLEPASGKGFALAHATVGVRAGRSKNYHGNHREAGDGVAPAVSPLSGASESGEAPRGHYGQAVEHASPSLQRGRLHGARTFLRQAGVVGTARSTGIAAGQRAGIELKN